MAAAAKATGISTSRTRKARAPKRVVAWANDHYSAAIDDLVPELATGLKHNRYLDVVQWNIEWFGAAKSTSKDKQRIPLIAAILERINAELFVFQEVVGPTPTRPGVLDDVARVLTERGAGTYVVDYTQAGGEQRVAMMWDRDVLRAKTDVAELFKGNAHKPAGGKDPFAGRTPLYGYFQARAPGQSNQRAFDFQALGVHLKAMGDGAAQRLASARILSTWFKGQATEVDSDVMIVGDFNDSPGAACFKPFHKLENEGKAAFRTINDEDDFSYLWLRNGSDQYVSRIDLAVVSTASMTQVADDTVARAIRWKPIEQVIEEASGELRDTAVRKVLAQVKDEISDHLPTLSRFYFSSPA